MIYCYVVVSSDRKKTKKLKTVQEFLFLSVNFISLNSPPARAMERNGQTDQGKTLTLIQKKPETI